MSKALLLNAAAAGAAGGDVTYVDDVFSIDLWRGNSGTLSVTNGIDFTEGGLVWIKNRGKVENHILTDTTSNGDKFLSSNQVTGHTNFYVGGGSDESFTLSSTGFSSTASDHKWNDSGYDYVGWSFRKQEKFFDIVTYTGNGTNGRSVAHNLGSVPGMIWIKNLTGESWSVYHRSIGNTKELVLNSTSAADTSSAYWNNTSPTSTHFTLGTVGSGGPRNENGVNYIAYLFAHNEEAFGEYSDEAIIKCDSFTTTSTWGNFKENIGFEPQWLMVKRTDSTSDWMVLDSMRGVHGPGDQALVDTGMFGSDSDDQELKANSDAVESTQGRGGFYSKGYLGNLGGFGNANYVYMAIRRPNKPASEFAANKLFSIDGAGNASGNPDWVSNGHVVDWAFLKYISGTEGAYATARLTGPRYINLHETNQEAGDGTLDKDFQSGFGDSSSSAVANYQAWMFRRAKKFFDVVTYVGDGTSYSFAHNLGVTPEFKIIRIRNESFGWLVGGSALTGGTTNYMLMLNTDAAKASTNYWSAVDSATQFSVKHSNFISNANGYNYIAFLFATVAGISKVGSYTGTGSNLNVDCGFSAGSRFILIKRTDSTGDWYVYDSVRGIVAGNDPYFLLNSTAAQVTNTDYIDPLSSGFTVTSSAPAALNASGGTYLFLAIA